MKKRFAFFLVGVISVFYLNLFIGVITVKANTNEPILINYFGKAKSPVFHAEDGKWSPGMSKEKTFFIENRSNKTYEIEAIKFAMNIYDADGDMVSNKSEEYKHWMDHLHVNIVCENNILYNGSVESLVDNAYRVEVGAIIESMKQKEVLINMNLDEEASNVIQGGTSKFDMVLACVSDDAVIKQFGSILDTSVLVILGITLFVLGIVFIKIRKNKF